MTHTIIYPTDKLPLTCSRRGTCCHGNQVLINPWELATLANTKGITISDFARLYTEFEGTRLLFNGNSSENGKKACSQYIDNFGCSLHTGRPLVCRLYPVGRRMQNNEIQYIFEGKEFPCMNGCPEVTKLPYMSLNEYLAGQHTERFEKAQDMYLELLQGIADIAFTLILETGLTREEILNTLKKWVKVKDASTENLVTEIEKPWKNMLILPDIPYDNDSEKFITRHSDYIRDRVQQVLSGSETAEDFQKASVSAFATALLLAFSLGIDFQTVGSHWIDIAKANLPEA